MKICLDIRVSSKGGTSTFIRNFVRELARVNHHHEIVFLCSAGESEHSIPGQSVTNVPFRNRFLEFSWSQSALPWLIRREQFDVYHSLKHVGPLFSPTKSIYRVPAVGQFLGNYPLPAFEKLYWRGAAGIAYRNADLLIAVSDYVRRGLLDTLKLPEERVVVIHNGVDPKFRRFSEEERAKRPGGEADYLLCVGNLLPVKNFATAIRAFAVLDAKGCAPQKLRLAGSTSDPHFTELKQLTSDLGLTDRVEFLGRQSEDRLLELYNGALALLHPSLHEGFSFTILEAMACGLPIVASSTSSIPEAAGDAAFYHDDPTDVQSLASCVQRILEDRETAELLSVKALRRASEFTWERCVKRTLATYERLG